MKKHKDYRGLKRHHWVYFIIFFWLMCQFFGVLFDVSHGSGVYYGGSMQECGDAYHGVTQNHEYIFEWDYASALTGNITKVEISGFYSSALISHYYLWVNNQNLTTADSYYLQTNCAPSNHYVFTWENIVIVCANEGPVFELYRDGYSGVDYGLRKIVDDFDGDGDQEYNWTESYYEGIGNVDDFLNGTVDATYRLTNGEPIYRFYLEEEEGQIGDYFITINSIYDTSNCIDYNNYITFYIDTTPNTGIYWILDNSTNYNVSEGAYPNNYPVHTLKRWIDQDYGIGEWNLWVFPYDYYLEFRTNYSYALNYSFCVSAGTERIEFIDVEKEIYYTGDEVKLSFRGVDGVQYYIKIFPSGEETTPFYNTTKTGTGVIQEFNKFWIAQRYDETLGYDVFYVWLFWASNNTKVPNVEDIFKVYSTETGVSLTVSPTTIRQYQSVTISGTYPFDKEDIFLKIELEDVWVDTLVVDNSFSKSYKCKDYGNYTVTMVYVGHDYISRSWYVTEEVEIPDYFSDLPAEFKLIIGAVLIMIFVCIPLILMRKAKIKNSAIMEGIVASMMFLGMGFSTAWGLIPDYILPSALLVFAIIVFLVWFSKRQREG